MKKVDFLFFDAGGGHRSAATALKSVVEQQQRPWQVELVNLQEVLKPLDIFRKVTGINMEDVYNHLLAKGWTLGSRYLIPPMHGLIRLHHRGQVRMLTQYWKEHPPDMVVSVIPNFNRAIHQALKNVNPSIPLVTILTDMADFPPHFWLERQDQYIICGTEEALRQAHGMGHDKSKVFLTSGMILRPSFYQELNHDRAAERQKLGLHPDKPTGLVLFGGQGSKVMLTIAERLKNANLDAQFVFICGRNEALANKLRQVRGTVPFHVVGFTQDVPYYMHLSDFMIGKPGPGSISEAIEMKLPVIVECNAWTLPQEVFNTEWVRQKGVGVVLRNFTEIRPAIEKLVAALPDHRARTAQIRNRAIFEIPEILDDILNHRV